MRYETEDGTKITFKELFEKLESDVMEIDKRILEVQTIATPSNKDTIDPVLAYMNGSQVLLRALLMKYRKKLALSNAMDWSDKAIDDLRTASYYGRDYALKASDKAIKDLEKAVDEYKESVTDVLSAAKNMKETYAKISHSLPADSLIDPAIIDAVTRKNEPKQEYPKASQKK